MQSHSFSFYLVQINSINQFAAHQFNKKYVCYVSRTYLELILGRLALTPCQGAEGLVRREQRKQSLVYY